MSADEHDAYADIVAWYDIEHDQVTEDLECYQELLGTHVAPRASVLEIGSGTGRIAAALAAAGYSVTGVEPSAAMRAGSAHRLAGLPARVARRVRIVSGTATQLMLAPSDLFDAVLFGLNTFAHLTTLAERQQALAAFSAHLRPGGIALLDLDLAGPRRMAESAGHVWWQGGWPVAESAASLTHFVVGEPSGTPGAVRLTHFYDVHEQGGPVRRTTATMDLAILTRGEIDLGLLHAGFVLPEAYGSYDLAPFEESSLRLIAVARKRD
ncbi:MAG TPA: class I SAM-dependent methyltransferase [Ktedonobacterales bacterium]|jgi:SAM-dependent methyltransferase|nr:class I SAM-dependent methyltransferase [Ktedonobacterales bacterium]